MTDQAEGREALIHLRVPGALKARWVRDSRAAGMRLTDWIIDRVEHPGEPKMNKIQYNNHEYDFDAAVNLMDDDIREALHSRREWASDQDFFDAYVAAHAEKFGEDFAL